MMQGKLDDAIASFRLAIKLDPENANTHNDLFLALKELGHSRQGDCRSQSRARAGSGFRPGPFQPWASPCGRSVSSRKR